MNNNNNNKIEWKDIHPLLDKNKIYYLWTGRRYKSADVYYLVTCLKLLTLKHLDGDWQYNLFHGYIGRECRGKENKNPAPAVIRFGVYPMYYITESDKGRVGWIRPKHKIGKEERCTPADIFLEKAVYPESAEKDHTGQLSKYGKYLLHLYLSGAKKPEAEEEKEEDTIAIPEFYLSRKMSTVTSNLFFRDTVDVKGMIENSPEYDNRKTVDQNEKDIMMSFGKNAGVQRVAFPWKYFTGQGVPVADPSIFGNWYCVSFYPEENLYYEVPGVVVNLGPQWVLKE